MSFYMVFGNKIANLIKQIDEIGEMITSNFIGMESITVSAIKKDGIRFSRFHIVLCICQSLSPLIFCINVPLMAYFEGTYRQRLPLPNTCSFEYYPPIYEVCVFFQVNKPF